MRDPRGARRSPRRSAARGRASAGAAGAARAGPGARRPPRARATGQRGLPLAPSCSLLLALTLGCAARRLGAVAATRSGLDVDPDRFAHCTTEPLCEAGERADRAPRPLGISFGPFGDGRDREDT